MSTTRRLAAILAATSAHGTKQTWSDVRLESVMRAKADVSQRYEFMSTLDR
jgi:hypothetical protein